MKDMVLFSARMLPGLTVTGTLPRVLVVLLLSLVVMLGALPGVVRGGDDPLPVSQDLLRNKLGEGHWNPDVPVDIQSEQMTVDFDSRRIVFQGDVRVSQADFSLTAQTITAIFGKDAEDIEKIIAKGDVTITKTDKTGWGQEAMYDREKAMVRLTGDPCLKQGKNYIRGSEISVFLEEDRMDVKGAVKAEFRLKESENPLD